PLPLRALRDRRPPSGLAQPLSLELRRPAGLDRRALARPGPGRTPLLTRGRVGTILARDPVCEIRLGVEHVLGAAAIRLRAQVVSERRARTGKRPEPPRRDD